MQAPTPPTLEEFAAMTAAEIIERTINDMQKMESLASGQPMSAKPLGRLIIYSVTNGKSTCAAAINLRIKMPPNFCP